MCIDYTYAAHHNSFDSTAIASALLANSTLRNEYVAVFALGVEFEMQRLH